MNHKRSLVKKLILNFLLLNIFTVLAVGTYSYYKAKNALVNRTYDQLTSLRIEKKYRIERFFHDRIQDILKVSKSKDIINILQIAENTYRNMEDRDSTILLACEQSISKPFNSGNFYVQFAIINNNGNSIIVNNKSDSASFIKFKPVDETSFQTMFDRLISNDSIPIEDYSSNSKNGHQSINIGTPVFNDSGLKIASLVFELNVESINEIMFEDNLNNGLGESGESYLVGEDYLMRSASRFQNNSVFNTKVETEGVIRASRGETGTAIIKDYRNIEVLSSYSPVNIPGLKWTILSEIDQREAMIPIFSIGNNIFYISLIILLFSFAIVYLIASKISKPIIKLKDAALKITSGNYDVFVEEIKSNDELESLVEAFNEMSSKIKEQTEKLKLEKSTRLSIMIDAQEAERQRLSRELHDGLGQSILGIKMRLERIANSSPETTEHILEETSSLFTKTIEEIRSISNNLSPSILNEFGLLVALKNLVYEVSDNSGIVIHFDAQLHTEEIDKKIQIYLYRITQEALNNIIKHADADSAKVSLISNEQLIELFISDNGLGFDPKKDVDLCCNGISNMKERINILQGNFSINSSKNQGTEIHLTIPFIKQR